MGSKLSPLCPQPLPKPCRIAKTKGLMSIRKRPSERLGGQDSGINPAFIYVALCSKSIIPNYIYSLHLHTSTHLSVINIHQCTSPLWHKFKKDMEIKGILASWVKAAHGCLICSKQMQAAIVLVVGILWPAKESWGTRPWSYFGFRFVAKCLCAFR